MKSLVLGKQNQTRYFILLIMLRSLGLVGTVPNVKEIYRND